MVFKCCYMCAVCYVMLVVVCLYVMTVVCIVLVLYYGCCCLYCYVMFVIVNVVINAICISRVLFLFDVLGDIGFKFRLEVYSPLKVQCKIIDHVSFT